MSGEVTQAANALVRYDAILWDLHVRESAVLWDRLRDAERQLLAVTGAESVQQARERVGEWKAKPTPTAKKPGVAGGPTSGQPVPCRACRRIFPRTILVNQRCPACSAKPTPSRKPTPPHEPAPRRRKGKGQPRQRALPDQINREQQEDQSSEAAPSAPLPARNGCPVCGSHRAHQCGQQWRLADGRIGEQPRRRDKGKGSRGGSSVWTVRGGLPGLGKRSR